VGSSRLSAQSLPRFVGSELPRVFTAPLRRLTERTSRGFECIRFAEDVLELELFPWQRWLLIHALELLPDGTFRFRTVVLLVARQNGKSTLLQVLSLWRMFVDGAPLVIGTAQNLDIAEEVWQGAVDMAKEVAELAAEIEKVDLTNGKKALRLVSGSRYKVQAASRRGGRGLSGDLILLDELREHQTWDAWSAVTKTTMARRLAQVWAASNAGDATSVVLSHLRLLAHLALGDPDGVNGDDARPDDLADDVDDESLGLFEWSAAPGCDVTDRAGWAQANPSLGHSITERAISSALKTDPERVFRTEVLCQWVDTMSEGAFPAGVWESTYADELAEILSGHVVAVDLRTGLRQSAAIVVAGRGPVGDLIHLARYESGVGERWADDFIFNEARKILDELGLKTVAVDGVGENEALIRQFEDAEFEVVKLNTGEMAQGAVGITDALINGRLWHRRRESQQPLDVSVLGAGKRRRGELFLWSWAASTTDITPLRAATVAWYVLASMDVVDRDPLEGMF